MVGRSAFHEDADEIYLSGVGMTTLEALQQLENHTGKIVLSATSCMIWNALRVSGIREPISGYGRLLANACQDEYLNDLFSSKLSLDTRTDGA